MSTLPALKMSCTAVSNLGIKRIIFTSSVAVYGFAAPYTDETAYCKPFNDYGRTKLLAEEVYAAWAAEDRNRKLAVVRPTVVFGEGNRGNVYNLFRQIAAGTFLFVGSGRNHKAMAYVGNVASFLAHIITSPEINGTWNYVDTPIPDMKQLVRRGSFQTGKRFGNGFAFTDVSRFIRRCLLRFPGKNNREEIPRQPNPG